MLNTSDPGDDCLLTAQAAKADPAAQRALVRRLLGRVQRLSRVLLRNTADAHDVSQTSMIQILNSAATFRGEGSLESWADRIVYRTAMRCYSRDKKGQLSGTLDDALSPVHANADPMVLVRQYLDQLSEPQGTALLLRHGFGYSVEEIAELTEVSPNTVKDRLLRARAAIRRLLRREQVVGEARTREGGR